MLLTTILASLITLAGNNPEEKYFRIKGRICDASSQSDLSGANISLPESQMGTFTDDQGYFSLDLPHGRTRLVISHLGYIKIDTNILVKDTLFVEFHLEPAGNTLGEIEVIAERERVLAGDAFFMSMEQCRKIPSFLGENDIIKALQVSPSVHSVLDGHSGFTVRGGSIDQNLILLDGATVYNPSHLLGFFSSFNNDAVEHATLYPGTIPANYGGRLSSVLSVELDDGNVPKFATTGEIGLISANLTLKGPLVKEKISFMVSGRRSYADLLFPYVANSQLRSSQIYFYDLYAKLRFQATQKSVLSITFFQGTDSYDNHYAFSGFSNRVISLQWSKQVNDRASNSLNAFYSGYSYDLGLTDQSLPHSFLWKSSIREFGFKDHLEIALDHKNKIIGGMQLSYYLFSPCEINGPGDNNMITEYKTPGAEGVEASVYLGHQVTFNEIITVETGLRLSSYNNLKPAIYVREVYDTGNTDTLFYTGQGIHHTDFGLEPRINIALRVFNGAKLHIAYNRTMQYIHRAYRSLAGTPLDVWFSTNPLLEPQVSDQYTIGIKYSFPEKMIHLGMEAYYKHNYNALDFNDHAILAFSEHLESDIRRGKAKAYGLEFSIRKDKGAINGQISYTFSRSQYQVNGVNNGTPYPSPYDVPHDLNILANFEVTGRLSLSANWVYSTGKPFTMPGGRAIIKDQAIPLYNNRNSHRLPDHHRLDLSITYRGSQKKRFRGDLTLSVYNAYNRKNVYSVSFIQEDNDTAVLQMKKNYLFPVMPSISYRFSF
jgi:outer membrane receptor for ferrienterochelin and colicin